MKHYSLLKKRAQLKGRTKYSPWKTLLFIGLSAFLLVTVLPTTPAKADTGQYSVNIDSSLSNGLIEIEIEGMPPELFVTVKNNSGAFPGTGGLWQAISYETIGDVTVEPLSPFGEFGILAPDSWNYYSVHVEGQGAVTFYSDITSTRAKVYYTFQNFFRLFPGLNTIVGETPDLIIELAATFDDLREVIESFIQAFSPDLGFFERVERAWNGARGIVDFLATEDNLADLSAFIWDRIGSRLTQIGIADESMLLSVLKKGIRLKDIGEVLLSTTQMIAYSLSGIVAGSTIIEIFEKPESDITPWLSISPENGTPETSFEAKWTGFSPNHSLVQHLRRVGGLEQETVVITTDGQGKATSFINSRVLSPGTYELWGVDNKSRIKSNMVEFIVEGEVDLSAYIVNLSRSSVATGENFSVTLAVKNNGNLSSGSFSTWIYASTLPFGTENFLTKVPFQSISPDNFQTASVNVLVPSSLGTGEYYITAYADAPGNGVILESHEDNNIGSSTPNQLIIQPPVTALQPPELTQSANGWYWPLGTSDPGEYLGWLALNPENNSYHLGQDFKGLESWPVYAIADGEVILSRIDVSGYGRGNTKGGALVARFTTSTGQQFLALYGHITNPHLEGTVRAGEILGYLNDYDPPHLHFGIYLDSEIPDNPWQGYTSNPEITYEWVDPLDFLEEYSPLILEPVTLKLYIHENSTNGPVIEGVLVTGQDGEGINFSEVTNSDGYVTIYGAPGTWSFTTSKSGYETKSWSWEITEDDIRETFLITFLLPAPSLISPHDGSIGISTKPTFSWTAVNGANKYWLMVATSPSDLPADPYAVSAPGCIVDKIVTSTSYTLIDSLSNDTTYYWQVQAFNDSRVSIHQGQFSTQWSFTTEKADITLKLYIHENSSSGPVIPDVLVIGEDGAGDIFSQITNSSGYVTIIGTPGTWSFTASKSGYNTNSWSQDITSTSTKHAYLTKGDVTLKLYIHENSPSGPVIEGVSVTGQDGEDNNFNEVTNSSGYVTITGVPGIWNFTASKSGYDTNSWSQDITETDTKHTYITETPTSSPTLVDVGIGLSPWPPQTFLQVEPGEVIYSHYTFSYSGPNILVNLKTTILDANDNEIGYQISGSGFWIINPFENPITGVAVEYKIADDAELGVYKVKFSIWNEDFTEEYDSIVKQGWLEIISGDVTLTLYVHEDSASGPVIAGVLVTGQDGEDNYFDEVTNSSGYVTITGVPGIWSFTASKDGYDTKTWSQSITTDSTLHAYLEEKLEEPDPPVPLSPGSSSSPGPTIDTLTPTLQWSEVSGADYYALAISVYPYGSSHIVYNPQQVYGTSITVPTGILSAGVKYRWNMQAHNSAGWSDVSNTLYFQTELDNVTLKLYIHENSPSGPVIEGVSVTGQDGEDNNFNEVTNSSGYVTITGVPGTWSFIASKDSYDTKSWSQDITADSTLHAYLIKTKVTLTISAGTGGTTNPSPGSYQVDQGSSQTITAIPSESYIFTGWSGSVTGTQNPITFTMDSDKSIIANFIQVAAPTALSPGSSSEPGPIIDTLIPTLQWSGVSGADYYAVAISKYPYGSSYIVYNPQQVSDTSVTVPSGTLVAGEKYRWNLQAHGPWGWSDVSNTLYFQTQANQITLTLYVHEGSASGPVIVGASVNGQDGAGNNFNKITNSSGYITITGVPGTWSFTASKDDYDTKSWSQDITTDSTLHAYLEETQQEPDPPVPLYPGSSSSPGPTIDTLTPTLQWSEVSDADYYALAISIYPYGSSNIVYNPQQVYGTSHTVPSGILESGQKYRWNMQAHNSAGWSDVSNTLYFQTQTTIYTLSINVQGQGTVNLSPSGGSYTAGTQVTLTATPASGWQFYSWSGDLTNSQNPITIIMDSNKNITTNFIQQDPPSAPTALSPGSSSEPGPIIDTLIPTLQWSGVSSADYYAVAISQYPYGSSHIIYNQQQVYGTSITVPNGILSAGVKYRWNMQAHNSAGWSDVSNTLYFQTQATTYNLSINIQGQGTVSLSPSGGSYTAGTQVTLTATPVSGWQFYSWSGDLTGSQNPTTITMNSNKSITATFTQQPPSAPTAISPGSSSSPGPTIDTLTPTLQWSSVSGADYYAVAISQYPYGSSHIVYNPQQVYGTSITVPTGILSAGVKYRWNMQAHNSAGWSDISNTLYFQTQTNQVILTLYVHENSASGPVIVGALVTGQDGAGNYFSQITNSSGYVTITGVPGTWSFTATKSGYDTNSWSQSITATDTKHAFLIKQIVYPQITSISPSQPIVQPTRQWISIFGSSFVSQSQVTLRIGGSTYVIPSDRTQFVNSGQINVFVGLTEIGTWSAQITNPDGYQSNIFYFQVVQ